MGRSNNRSLLMLCGLLSFAFIGNDIALAGPADMNERRTNRSDIREDKREIRDDAQDLNELIVAIDTWHRATSTHNRNLEFEADKMLKRWINEEKRENQVEVQEAKIEENQAQRERRRSRRESRRSDAVRSPAQSVDDRHDLRDDRRDHRDDRKDENEAKYHRQRTREISHSLRMMQPSFDSGHASPQQYSQKSALLRELEGLARRELSNSEAELQEDRRERREDRREALEPGR